MRTSVLKEIASALNGLTSDNFLIPDRILQKAEENRVVILYGLNQGAETVLIEAKGFVSSSDYYYYADPTFLMDCEGILLSVSVDGSIQSRSLDRPVEILSIDHCRFMTMRYDRAIPIEVDLDNVNGTVSFTLPSGVESEIFAVFEPSDEYYDVSCIGRVFYLPGDDRPDPSIPPEWIASFDRLIQS